ncbi:BRO-N domain-containing protein [Bacillus cereus]|uniref:BRO-N domain-containing protein n=1 Tax=Bacillus cereus TaxID=1396 RepID=UPI001A7EEF25
MSKDVAEWIEHTNTTNMLNNVDEDEKTTFIINTSGSYKSKVVALTEDGIYEVLMQSRKPIAKQWKKEVKKILKNIRLNGGHVQVDREEEFIHSHFPSFSEEVKKAMVLEVVDEGEKGDVGLTDAIGGFAFLPDSVIYLSDYVIYKETN